MQRFIYFFIIFPLISATDVFVYENLYYRRDNAEHMFRSAAPWKFRINSNDRLNIVIYIKNKSPSVTTIIQTNSGLKIVEALNVILSSGKPFTVYVHQLSGPKVIINLALFTSNGLCTSIRVAEGRAVITGSPKKTETEYKYADICFKRITNPCVLVVDLKDFPCKGSPIVTQKNGNLTTTTPLTRLENMNTTTFVTNSSANSTETYDQRPPSKNNGLIYVLIYVIPSVIGMCVIILVIYLCVKKCSHRNSHPAETMELNTYATAKEILYADLTMMHRDNQPPISDEESPYAEIIWE